MSKPSGYFMSFFPDEETNHGSKLAELVLEDRISQCDGHEHHI
jgi:hypothetical protein